MPVGAIFCENESIPGFFGQSRNLNARRMNMPNTVLTKMKTKPLYLHRFAIILSDGCHENNYIFMLVQKVARLN
jgi:hypothetical protein